MTMGELAKAQLQKLDAKFNKAIEPNTWVTVQFNPETLKVSYANQIQQPEGGGDKRGAQAQLFVGSGTTKLTCQLWFDVTAPQSPQKSPQQTASDVRELTNRVSHFITPKEDGKKFVPPAVRFLWGSFQFDGIMESVEESLEFFSPEGKPLRASVAIALTQQKIMVFPPVSANGAPSPGTTPTTPVPSGKSVQQVTGSNWQDTASRNNIENPRRPPPGQRLA
jgi:hypothetical protein